jgi:4-azaleucine resistance transporter AzlC
MPSSDFRSEFGAGALDMAPLALAATVFGLIVGAEATRAGLSAGEASLMSVSVFAGASQFLAIGLWSRPAPWLALGLAALLVNLRHALMAASIRRRFDVFPGLTKFAAVFVLTDESWALSERRARGPGLTAAYYLGASLTMYVLWQVATLAGTVLGGFVPHPEVFGLDFAFPAAFIGIVAGFAKSWRHAPVVLASAVAAFFAHRAFGGTWFVLIGAAAGLIAAALSPDDPPIPATPDPEGLP